MYYSFSGSPRIFEASVAGFYLPAFLNGAYFPIVGPGHALPIGMGNDVSVGVDTTLHIIAPHAHP